jgi:hypothetical protein
MIYYHDYIYKEEIFIFLKKIIFDNLEEKLNKNNNDIINTNNNKK